MNESFNIPFVDLVTPHRLLEDSLTEVFQAALRTAGFIGGSVVEDFEKAFGDFCTTEYCVGVSSGTDALRFALMAVGVEPGEIVITVPNTFIATTEAISQAGGTVAFVDINEQTYTLSPERLREFVERECTMDERAGKLVHKATGRAVTAVVPVHLYGQMADMDPIMDIADRYGLKVVEDACQAHGAEYYSRKANCWQRAGSVGRVAAFSFYPGKNLGACGEGGAVTTHDGELAHRVRMLRDHGQTKKYYHDVEGYNGRLDAIQAGILRVKLRYLAEWNRMRRELAARYSDLLTASGTGCRVPFEPKFSKGVYHLYVIRVPDRNGLRDELAISHIGTGIHYPIALHLQRAYEHLGYKEGDFPVAEKVAKEILSLPMYPQLDRQKQAYVVNRIQRFFSMAKEKAPETRKAAA